jgi:hypothetical protein
MAGFSQVRRILHVHAAHRTVGVSGVASSFRPASRDEASPFAELAGQPLRVSLVCRFDDRGALAALAAFERILFEKRNIWCERVELPTAESEGLGNADCAVVFGRGLQIVSRWVDVDAEAIAGDGFEGVTGIATQVEIAPAADWHPVVDGIGPFMVFNSPAPMAGRHTDATSLLVRRGAGAIFPVAWVRQSGGRAFGTQLGRAEDFRQPEFVRLLLNAVDWVGC